MNIIVDAKFAKLDSPFTWAGATKQRIQSILKNAAYDMDVDATVVFEEDTQYTIAIEGGDTEAMLHVHANFQRIKEDGFGIISFPKIPENRYLITTDDNLYIFDKQTEEFLEFGGRDISRVLEFLGNEQQYRAKELFKLAKEFGNDSIEID